MLFEGLEGELVRSGSTNIVDYGSSHTKVFDLNQRALIQLCFINCKGSAIRDVAAIAFFCDSQSVDGEACFCTYTVVDIGAAVCRKCVGFLGKVLDWFACGCISFLCFGAVNKELYLVGELPIGLVFASRLLQLLRPCQLWCGTFYISLCDRE